MIPNLNFRQFRHLLAFVFLVAGGTAFANNPNLADLNGTRVDLGVKQGKIIDIMDIISERTEYVFIYEDGLKKELNKKVQIENGQNLRTVLLDITKQSELEFRAVNKNIVVRKRAEGQAMLNAVPAAQSQQISGRVLSEEDDSGLPGVNVVEKGTTNGTVTDIDGRYSLSVAGPQSVLVFSSVGFETQEVAVGTQSMINVTLAPDVQALDEIVVTALGIEREQRSLGYDVSEVEGEALQEVAQDNVLNSLAGRVPGVTINQTSGPGSTVQVTIRGATSLTTDNQPLFVVDGVPMNNSLNNVSEQGSGNNVDYGNAISDINPNDIESMTVLKGPSAAALYGTRAGNGVIIITTKSGKGAKKLGVDVSTNTLFEWPTVFLDFHYKYANGGRNSTLDEGSAYWGGPELDAGNVWPQFGYDEPTELRSFPDNMKNFMQTGVTSTNTVALTGGGDKGNFRISYSNMSMRGMVPESDRYVNSLKTSINHQILDNLEFTSNVTISRTKSNDIPSLTDRRSNPLQAVYQWPHVDIALLEDYWVPGLEGIQQATPGGEDNPYFIVHGVKNSFFRDRLYGNAALKYNFTDELSLQVRGNLDRFSENRETKVPFSADRMQRGNYTIQNLTFQEVNADFLLAYNKKLTNWDFNVSFGGNIMNQQGTNHRTSSADRRDGLVIPGLYSVNNIPPDKLNVSNSGYERAIYSLYGLASIGYAGQLYLDVTARNDWSSTLPAESRSYFYPSASLSWLANYTFNLPETVSLLKFRGGWAQVGNDTNPYQLAPVLGLGSWNTLPALGVPGTLLNPNLQPEENTSIEGGVDLALFSNKFRFSATYYNMDNVNQIFDVAMPRSSGYAGRKTNAGRINSQGVEITLGFTPIQNSNGLTWDVDFNFTRNVTTLQELPEGGRDYIQIWGDNGGAYTWLGEEIGNMYSYGYAKVQDPNSPYYQWPILEDGGWIAFRDIDNLEKVGNFNPDFLVGMQSRLTFGNWTVSASLDWRAGGDFTSFTYRYGESDWRSQRQLDQIIPGGLLSTEELATLLKSDPEENIIPQNGKFPRVGGHTAETGGFPLADGNDGAFVPGVIQTAGVDTPNDPSDDEYEEHLGGPGTFFYPITDTYPWRFNKNITFDASFIKLRELSVGYRLPAILGVTNANFAVYTRNLMLWTKSQVGIDPERAFGSSGGGGQGDTSSQWKQGYERQNVMPWSASLGFKLNFSF